MVAPQQTGRRRATLGLLFLAAASLITLDFQNFGPIGTIQTGVREVIAPFRTGGERIVSPITGLWDGATQFDELQLENDRLRDCLLYTSPSPRDATLSRMPSSA